MQLNVIPATSGDGELAFLGNALESLSRALDPVLAVIAVCRQQADHFVGSTGGRAGHVACSEIDGLSDDKLVLQRPLHHATRNAGLLTIPAATADLKSCHRIACEGPVWPARSEHGKCL